MKTKKPDTARTIRRTPPSVFALLIETDDEAKACAVRKEFAAWFEKASSFNHWRDAWSVWFKREKPASTGTATVIEFPLNPKMKLKKTSLEIEALLKSKP